MSTHRITARLLGASAIVVGSRTLSAATEALFALAIFLTTTAGQTVRREELLGLLWPDGDETSRRHAMRQMLYRARRLGVNCVELRDGLYLDPAEVDSDLRVVLDSQWPETATLQMVVEAHRPLPSFSARLAPTFLAWYDALRDSVQLQIRRAAQNLCSKAHGEGRWRDVETLACIILETDPFNEAAVLARAESVAMSGSKQKALEILDQYISEISSVSPTLGKPAYALRRRIAERRADWRESTPREVELIGRLTEVQELIRCIEGASKGASKHCHLVGAAGIGKSRLLREAREYAALRGLRVVNVQLEPFTSRSPLGAFRAIVAQLLDLPGAVATPPQHLTVLKTLATAAPDAALPITSNTPQTLETLALATQQLVHALVQEVRVVVTLDDLQYSDPSSLSLVASLEAAAFSTRLCMISAARHSEPKSGVAHLAEGVVTICRLGPLDRAQSAALFTSIRRAHRIHANESDARLIGEQCGGNPLFIREFALAGRSSGSRSVPDSLGTLIRSRLEKVSEHPLRVLRLASLLGDAASVARVARLCGTDLKSLQDSVEQLELDGILSLREDGVLALHDAWSDAVSSQMPSTARASLALECAEALLEEVATGPSAHAARASHLLALAGDHERALDSLLSASDELLAAGLANEAMDQLQPLPPLSKGGAAQAKLDARKARIHLIRGDIREAEKLADACLGSPAASHPKLSRDRLLAAVVRADVALRTDELHAFSSTDLLILSKSAQLDRASRQVACLTGVRIAANRLDLDSLREFADECRDLSGGPPDSLSSWLTAVISATELGSAEEIKRAINSAPRQALSAATIAERCLSERVASIALRFAGDQLGATARGESAYELSMRHGLYHQARAAADVLAFNHMDYLDLEQAAIWIQRGLDLERHSKYGVTHTSTAHALDRLLIQQEKFDALLLRIDERPPSRDVRSPSPNRFGALSLAALVYATAGREEDARAYTQCVERALPKSLGQLGLHFTAEILCRAYAALGDERNRNALRELHVRDMRAGRRAPLPPFYSSLRGL